MTVRQELIARAIAKSVSGTEGVLVRPTVAIRNALDASSVGYQVMPTGDLLISPSQSLDVLVTALENHFFSSSIALIRAIYLAERDAFVKELDDQIVHYSTKGDEASVKSTAVGGVLINGA